MVVDVVLVVVFVPLLVLRAASSPPSPTSSPTSSPGPKLSSTFSFSLPEVESAAASDPGKAVAMVDTTSPLSPPAPATNAITNAVRTKEDARCFLMLMCSRFEGLLRENSESDFSEVSVFYDNLLLLHGCFLLFRMPIVFIVCI